MCCGHGCHKSRGAKATLRPVVRDHGLLHRMQRAVRSGQPLHRAHAAALQLGQKQYAGIHRAGHAILSRDDDGAGTAIPFVTAFFGAAEIRLKA